MSALRQAWIHSRRHPPVHSPIATLLRNFLRRMRSLDTSFRCVPSLHACYLGELSQWSPGWVVHQAEPTLKYSCLLAVYLERQRFVLHDIPGAEKDLAPKNLAAVHESSGAGSTGT
jgi:hypothetical protein